MPDILTMDDSEFIKNFDTLGEQPAEPVVETPEVAVVEPAIETPVVEETPVEEAPAETTAEETPAVEEAVAGEEAPAAVVETPAQQEEVDYKAFYESIIGKPMRAGGKEVVIQSADEAIKLAKMGVGFHSKMSKLAHAERIIETLRENDLLDDSKINELIDISKKNPEAIAALVQSAGLEPHQLIPSGDAQTYTPGDHVLPEAQILFRNTVDEVRENGGEEFLAHVAQDWDVTSRAEIYNDPNALTMIYGHKQMGIYDQISSEVHRRRVFDPSVAKMPFVHAYLEVGNEMHGKGMLAPQQAQPAPAPVPVAVKPAVASQPVNPNPAAAKAAAVRSAPNPATETPNYLTMSDEEFLKHHKPT